MSVLSLLSLVVEHVQRFGSDAVRMDWIEFIMIASAVCNCIGMGESMHNCGL